MSYKEYIGITFEDIDWDVSDDELEDSKKVSAKELGLPVKVKVDCDDFIDKEILYDDFEGNIDDYINENGADWLSDKYGWCVNGFKYRHEDREYVFSGSPENEQSILNSFEPCKEGILWKYYSPWEEPVLSMSVISKEDYEHIMKYAEPFISEDEYDSVTSEGIYDALNKRNGCNGIIKRLEYETDPKGIIDCVCKNEKCEGIVNKWYEIYDADDSRDLIGKYIKAHLKNDKVFQEFVEYADLNFVYEYKKMVMPYMSEKDEQKNEKDKDKER